MTENDIQYLRNDLAHLMEINELKHNTILEKLEMLDKTLNDKTVNVSNVLAERTKEVDTRFEKLEIKTDSLVEWRIYTIALVSVIAVFLPYVLDKLFP